MKNVNYGPALTGVVIVVLILLAACGPSVPETEGLSNSSIPEEVEQEGENSGDGPATPTDSQETDGLPPDDGQDDIPLSSPDIEMAIAGFAFAEKTIVVPAGTTVTWENGDTVSHTVTTVEEMFHSGLLSRGETFSYTFEQPGEYNYFCTIHPYMRATIIVE